MDWLFLSFSCIVLWLLPFHFTVFDVHPFPLYIWLTMPDFSVSPFGLQSFLCPPTFTFGRQWRNSSCSCFLLSLKEIPSKDLTSFEYHFKVIWTADPLNLYLCMVECSRLFLLLPITLLSLFNNCGWNAISKMNMENKRRSLDM